MATDVNTLGCTYGSGDNTAAFQSAVDLGIPLIVSGALPCPGIITIDDPATTIEGAGSLALNRLVIKRIGGYTGVDLTTSYGYLHIHPTADVRNVIFSSFIMSSYISFGFGALTAGCVLDGIDFSSGITPVLSWNMDGVEVKNCTITGPVSPTGSHAAFMINGCDNLIHDNVFNLDGYRNAILFGSILGDGPADYIWKPSCRGNLIYNNTVIGGHEERISYDGYAGYNSLYTAYVTDITGSTVTVDLQKSTATGGTVPASFDGFDMVVVSGDDPGQNFEIESKTSATIWVLKAAPATLTVGDFISIGSYFIDNEIYGNTITSPDGSAAGAPEDMTVPGWTTHAKNGTAISLSFGCLNNHVHDNTIEMADELMFLGGPTLEWYIPLTGIVNSGIIATSATDWTDYTAGTLTMQNTRYSMNSRNRIINNHINGIRVPYSAYHAVNSNNPVYAFPQTILPVGMPWMYDWNSEVSLNDTDSTVFTGLPVAQTQLTYQRDLTFENNLFPPISQADGWLGSEPGEDNTYLSLIWPGNLPSPTGLDLTPLETGQATATGSANQTASGTELNTETGTASATGTANAQATGTELSLETGTATGEGTTPDTTPPGWYLQDAQGRRFKLVDSQGRSFALQPQ